MGAHKLPYAHPCYSTLFNSLLSTLGVLEILLPVSGPQATAVHKPYFEIHFYKLTSRPTRHCLGQWLGFDQSFSYVVISILCAFCHSITIASIWPYIFGYMILIGRVLYPHHMLFDVFPYDDLGRTPKKIQLKWMKIERLMDYWSKQLIVIVYLIGWLVNLTLT